MKIDPSADKASIVLVGAFNPRIFHPSWLALNKLISDENAEDAKTEIVHPDISRFTAAYMAFEVRTNRFLVQCETIHKDLIKDLVLSAFGEYLPHSPVWQFGLNRTISFSCGSEDVRHSFGNRLAPKDPWGAWGKKVEQSESDSGLHGGMIQLVMRETPRSDGLKGHVQADVRPMPGDSSSVFVEINNHFVVSDSEEISGCLDAMELIDSKWDECMIGAEGIADDLMATVMELK